MFIRVWHWSEPVHMPPRPLRRFPEEHAIPCPYGKPGDRLWVREAWRHTAHDLDAARALTEDIMSGTAVAYRADDDDPQFEKWRPSIHMPRWASRTALEITDVRVERLLDISQADARAEGAPPSHPSIDVVSRQFGYADFSRSWYAQQKKQNNNTNTKNENPWVWVLEFKRVTP